MKFTLSWLKEHLDTTANLAEMRDRLTMLGLEVEGITNPAEALKGFVVGYSNKPHVDVLSAVLELVCIVLSAITQWGFVPNLR